MGLRTRTGSNLKVLLITYSRRYKGFASLNIRMETKDIDIEKSEIC